MIEYKDHLSHNCVNFMINYILEKKDLKIALEMQHMIMDDKLNTKLDLIDLSKMHLKALLKYQRQ